MSKKDIVNEIHRSARKNFLRRQMILKDIDDLWQADLIDMQNIKSQNSNFKFILIVIDTFSKYAWAMPLKSKNKFDVYNAFKQLLSNGRHPKNMQTDLGTEFYNDKLQKLMKSLSINHYSTYSIKKASIAERLIRTIKSKLFKEFSLKGNYKWSDGTLDKIILNYNNSNHRTIGCKPIDVSVKNKKALFERYLKKQTMNCISNAGKRLKVGDYVRISKYKGVFEKGYTPNWSTEIFNISKVQNTSPATYILTDSRNQPILGSFYAEELQKTKNPHLYLVETVLRKKGKKVLVKWLGLPSSENSWILKSDII